MLSILSVAYPFAPVGPDAVGGAEQVLTALDRALVASGNHSIVVACEGSRVAGRLVAVPLPVCGEIDSATRRVAHAAVEQAIASVIGEVDLVHMHGVDFHAYLPSPGKPALITLHLPMAWYSRNPFDQQRPGTWFNCVSQSQHDTCPAEVNLTPPIPNGIPVEALAEARHACRGYALMLGRVCPEKGQHIALKAAHYADVPLLLAGEVFPYAEHRAYFDDCVRPLLDHRRRYLGPIGFIRKRRLLSAATCVLVPSLCAETSSLVAREALACGTPVIALPNGALPETIEHGRTGYLVETVEDMAAAVRDIGTIDRALCQQVARERFGERQMTDAYLDLYQTLANAVDRHHH